VVDRGNGKLLADRIPGAQLVIFPELGHLLFWEDPDGFVDAVASPTVRPGTCCTPGGGSIELRRRGD
jgi:pimeloyl-ACP methyl ester carboxylesterase